MASGVGNGLGTIIAGFTTAQGYSYEFAFQIEATVLFLLAVALLATSSESLIYRTATESTAPWAFAEEIECFEVKTKSPKHLGIEKVPRTRARQAGSARSDSPTRV